MQWSTPVTLEGANKPAILANDESLHTVDERKDFARLEPVLRRCSPHHANKTGSPQSLISWDSLGAQGRNRVAAAPTRADIEALTGGPAMEPLRIYVGANPADTAEDRAALALAELIRTGAFDRSPDGR